MITLVSLKLKISGVIFICLLLFSFIFIININDKLTAELEKEAKENLQITTESASNKIYLMNLEIEKAVEDIDSIVNSTIDLNASLKNTDTYFKKYTEEIKPQVKTITYETDGAISSYVYFNVELYKKLYDVWCLHEGNSENGSQFYCTDEQENLSMFYPENPTMVWYYAPILERKSVWTDIYYDETLEVNCISYVKPLIKDGIVIGMVGMDTSFKKREDVVNSIKVFSTGYALMIDNKNELIIQPKNKNLIEKGYLDLVINEKLLKEKGVIETEDIFLSFLKLKSGQTIIVVAEKKEVLSGIEKMKLQAFTIGIILIPIILLIGFILSVTILRPITKLKNATNEITKGNLDTDIGVKSDDEIGELASAFKIMTEELQRTTVSKQTMQTILNSMPYGIILIGMDKKIMNANRAALDIMGYESEEQVAGQICNNVLCPEDDKCPIIDLKQKVEKSEKVLITKDGRHIPILKTVVPVKLGDRDVLLEAFVDISERKRNEEIRRENERLELANKAKSEFLAIMSHELRTPLNAILGFSELLMIQGAGELNERQQRYADNVHSSGKHLLNIIDDILDLTRVESGKMELKIEKVSVPAAVNDVIENIREMAGKQNIIIKTELKPEVEFIETDGMKLKQVLNNILSNAVKFSKPDGGTVTITAKKEMDMVKFSVSDSGIGIKDKDMCKLFQSFEQLDAGIGRKYGGTGLGLAVSKKLVELLGGRITAESKYSVGSTFTFLLPIAGKKQA